LPWDIRQDWPDLTGRSPCQPGVVRLTAVFRLAPN
jgi:hypothetical protein